MNDNQCLALMAALFRSQGTDAMKAGREAANIAVIFGLKVPQHTQDLLKIRPIYADSAESRDSGKEGPDSGSNPDARSVLVAPDSPTENQALSAVSVSGPLAEEAS